MRLYPKNDKYKILDEYIKCNDIIHISELPNFTNKLKSLHFSCIRTNILLIKIDDNTYRKVGKGYYKKNYIFIPKRKRKIIKKENFSLDIGY